MADKKVERSVRERPLTPRQKMDAALSDPGTVNMAMPTRDKGKSALADKFREREERWRREQALSDRQASQELGRDTSESSEAGEAGHSEDQREGGDA
ncbi:MAG: hypothetical protein GX113_06090 [Actinobacteria bacterium]|jgi:hypothetical protein|nr:hypothetical protein [Actinomycetota bacterium]